MYFTQKYCVDLDVMCICHVPQGVLHCCLCIPFAGSQNARALFCLCLLTYGTSSADLFLFQIYYTHLPEYMGIFLLLIEVFPIDFSLYLMLFLKTPKACVMTQGSHFSLDSSLPRKGSLAQEKASSSRFPNSILSLGEHSKLQGS